MEKEMSLTDLKHEMSTMRRELLLAERAREQVVGDARGLRAQLTRAADDAGYLTEHTRELSGSLARTLCLNEELDNGRRAALSSLGGRMKDAENCLVEARLAKVVELGDAEGKIAALRATVERMETEAKGAAERERVLAQQLQVMHGRVTATEENSERFIRAMKEERERDRQQLDALRGDLAEARRDKMKLWEQSREDKFVLVRKVDELQRVMAVLKDQKEEEYRIGRRDREVLVSCHG
eukprot:TRINITY_DN18160_c0_g1_i2.p2 TRINITY_DN18160_c0_g1~~TRINITY_DN18160_c0_g1_i2.p2  ORF type:complete len:239 (+),score=83.48 TRINITY_DN18160_c0_g1_i2:209-925(+)